MTPLFRDLSAEPPQAKVATSPRETVRVESQVLGDGQMGGNGFGGRRTC